MNEETYKEEGWTQIITGRAEKKPEISFSNGKTARYVRFNQSFLNANNLDEKEYYVKVLTKKENDKVLVGFIFTEEIRKGLLKLSKNKDSGSGYISGSSVFSQIGNSIRDKTKLKFEPQKEKIGEDEIFVIEIKN